MFIPRSAQLHHVRPCSSFMAAHLSMGTATERKRFIRTSLPTSHGTALSASMSDTDWRTTRPIPVRHKTSRQLFHGSERTRPISTSTVGRLFLMGHSAGCAHAASYAYDNRFQPERGHSLRGLILVSGRVRADTLPENPNAKKVEAYYRTSDAQELDALSPISHVHAGSVATLVAWAEYENPLIDVYSAELVIGWLLRSADRRRWSGLRATTIHPLSHTSTRSKMCLARRYAGLSSDRDKGIAIGAEAMRFVRCRRIARPGSQEDPRGPRPFRRVRQTDSSFCEGIFVPTT